ncbi:hypothetical protein BDN71DRAFT_998474 [Pleurotus eryngii]|uniref:F-box domain-containing protein n=1 Tax=Pleurotus eryngii TaxID=5323 RepID=A0A9P6DFC2_PLEER|nr:hypothetical protein BDN71DRAFT_998474 [Pleurotus eryngii]
MTRKQPLLPTEVWLQIASYIPEREMPKLYLLSRAFYELGMDAIYQELRIRAFTKGMVSRIQNASKKPFISRRILALDIHLNAFDALVTSRAQSSLELFASLVYRAQGPHNVTRMSAPEIPSYRHINTYLPFIRSLWEGVRGRVVDLALEVPGNVLNVVLPVFADSPLQVHALSLVLYDNLDRWGSSYTSQYIANFFNQAAPGLESLSLVSPPTTPVYHLRLIFTRLYQFPKLQKVHLDIQFDDITGYNIAQFLNVHGQHIHTLSLTPHISPNSDTTPLATLRLPALIKLSLNFELETTQFNRFWASGFLTFTSLTHLRIDAPALAHDRFSLICDAFGRRITSHQVHDVHFNLQVLNGLVFDRLSTGFAALHTLSITANFLSEPNESDTWDIVRNPPTPLPYCSTSNVSSLGIDVGWLSQRHGRPHILSMVPP